MKTLADMHKDVLKGIIEDLLEHEQVLIKFSRIENRDVFNLPVYNKRWQYKLDQCREEIKRAKSDFRNIFQEDFIPGY